MKLYATVTSERASKGQGGKTLEIVVSGEQHDTLWKMKVVGMGKIYKLTITDELGKPYPPLFSDWRKKGERRKGEGCMYDHDHAKGGCISHN